MSDMPNIAGVIGAFLAAAGVCLPIIVIMHGVKRYFEIMGCAAISYILIALGAYSMTLAVSSMP